MMSASRILVVDDDLVILRFVRAILEARNFGVITVEDGESALQVMNRNPADLIVLDIMMPGIDGFEICRRLREWSKVPVIMLSAKDHSADKIKAYDVGADDFVTKPFDVGDLIARIRILLHPDSNWDNLQLPDEPLG